MHQTLRCLSVPAAVLAALLGSAGCLLEPGPDDVLAEDPAAIDITKCSDELLCPAAVECDRVWSDAPRKPEWGACPAPPEGCTQVVLGRFDDMKKYLGCPGYITLNLKDWTKKKNDEFIGCVAADKVGATCDPKVIVVSTSAGIPDDGNQTNIELCELEACGCKVTVDDGKVKVAKCDPTKKKKAKPAEKKKEQVCTTALAVDTHEVIVECAEVWSCASDCGPGDDCEPDPACGCTACDADSTDPACVDSDVCLASFPDEPDETDADVEAVAIE